MKNLVLAASGCCVALAAALGLALPARLAAQTAPAPQTGASNPDVAAPKLPVYGELGLGFGKTLFRGDTEDKLSRALGGRFRGGTGINLSTGFCVAPAGWRGLGVGARVKGTFGTPVRRADGPDEYIFNYYTVALTAKYYVGRTFNQGLYGRGSFGFGQFTAKRLDEAVRSYTHQYAIGSSALLGVGYTLRRPSGLGLSLEAEYDLSSRSGTVDGVGDVGFGSGQIGVNVLVSF